MSKTDVAEADILKLFTGQATSIFSTTPITPYIGLQTTAASESSTGTEATGNAYARQSATFGTPTGTAPTTVANSGAVLFPAATPAGYTVKGAGLFTAVSAGSMLRWQAFSDLVLGINDQANFAIGAITFTED